MLELLKRLLNPVPEAPAISEAERLKLATCVLLVETAGADNEFAPQECERILLSLRGRFALSQEEAEDLLKTAQERRARTVDLWPFTNQINQACSQQEKIHIIEEVWRVIYADGALDAHEDYLVHKLARLLNLTHPQLIAAKLKIKAELGATDS